MTANQNYDTADGPLPRLGVGRPLANIYGHFSPSKPESGLAARVLYMWAGAVATHRSVEYDRAINVALYPPFASDPVHLTATTDLLMSDGVVSDGQFARYNRAGVSPRRGCPNTSVGV